MSKRHCVRHPDKDALWPPEYQIWCSVECAAEEAVGHSEWEWCDKHAGWYWGYCGVCEGEAPPTHTPEECLCVKGGWVGDCGCKCHKPKEETP